jgi:hypothetical protein
MGIQELDDRRLHCRVFEEADSAVAGVTVPGLWVYIETEIWI